MTPPTSIATREVPQAAYDRLLAAGLSPELARLLAARGVAAADELDERLDGLLAPDAMKGIGRAAVLLADAIAAREALCVVADYDCDGATACAVAVRGLRMLGARVDYLVPNRFEHGYGLTEPVVALACEHPRLGRPDWLITVDSGIASVDGVRAARERGLRVVITDHHLPGPQLPDADAIVDPNQPGCDFGSPHLAMYRRDALDEVADRFGVGLGSAGPELGEDALAALADLGHRYVVYDTGKIVNALIQATGGRLAHRDLHQLVHIGGLSHYLSPPGYRVDDEGETLPDWTVHDSMVEAASDLPGRPTCAIILAVNQ